MLALATGWTPDVLGELPGPFRSGCHWALYVRAIAGDDGLPHVEIDKEAPVQTRLAQMRVMAELNTLRTNLYPEDGDG